MKLVPGRAKLGRVSDFDFRKLAIEGFDVEIVEQVAIPETEASEVKN